MDDTHTVSPDDDERAPGGQTNAIRHYFVDEAGDGNIFNHRKEIVVGHEGCSVFFILGLLDVVAPQQLEDDVARLRAELLADPYLSKVPSMQPGQRKTAFAFHAKDDCPEVRREVFRMLLQHDVRFFALVRDKRVITQKVRGFQAQKPGYRYHPDQLYDRCISRLFRDRLHKDAGYTVCFSKRGNRSRTEALRKALEQARANFRHRFKVESTAPIEIQPATPAKMAGLQAVDYFLWALQRLYERGEERYWEFVAEKVSLVHDVDDIRNHEYGEYYHKRNPLTVAKCAKKEPGI